MEDRRIKVLLMIDDASIGGGQQHVLSLARGLNKDLFDIAVACEPEGYLVDEVKKEGIQFFPVSLSNIPSISSFFRCVKILNTFSPDILHTHGGTSGVYGRMASIFSTTRWTVHTYHAIHYLNFDNQWIKFWYTLTDRILLLITECIICVGRKDFDDGCRAGVVNPQKSFVITNGIDVENFHQSVLNNLPEEMRKERHGDIVIGSIGRLHHQKGYEYFIDAMPVVLKEYSNVVFHIVGGGNLQESLKRRCRELGIDSKVRFRGAQTNVPHELASMDIFVLPSLWEGFPIVLLEAMAAEKPIVATRVNGVTEIVEDGKEALLIPAKDPQAIAQGVLRLIRNPSLGRSLTERAYEKARTHFDVKQMISRTEKIYLGLAEGSL